MKISRGASRPARSDRPRSLETYFALPDISSMSFRTVENCLRHSGFSPQLDSLYIVGSVDSSIGPFQNLEGLSSVVGRKPEELSPISSALKVLGCEAARVIGMEFRGRLCGVDIGLYLNVSVAEHVFDLSTADDFLWVPVDETSRETRRDRFMAFVDLAKKVSEALPDVDCVVLSHEDLDAEDVGRGEYRSLPEEQIGLSPSVAEWFFSTLEESAAGDDQ